MMAHFILWMHVLVAGKLCD